MTVSQLKVGGPRGVQMSMNLVSPSQGNIEAPQSQGLHGSSLLDSRESFYDRELLEEEDEISSDEGLEPPEL